MELLAITYPELLDSDLEIIQDHRKRNDSLADIVGPHFTLIFPMAGIAPAVFAKEVRKRLQGCGTIPFCLRYACVKKDTISGHFQVFLTPDEGFNQIVKLHDRLYGDKFVDYWRRDIEYIPHITIGASAHYLVCKRMVEQWNAKDYRIAGIISSVEVVKLENRIVETLDKITMERVRV